PDTPATPWPSSECEGSGRCAGMEPCCMMPGRSENLRSTNSQPSCSTSSSTSAGVRSCIGPPTGMGSWAELTCRPPAHPQPNRARARTRRRLPAPATRTGTREPGGVVPQASGRLGQRAAAGVGDESGHDVGIAVGIRPAVLDVALLVDLDLPRDADRRTPVRHAVAELGPRGGLVEAGEATLDPRAVVLDVEV